MKKIILTITLLMIALSTFSTCLAASLNHPYQLARITLDPSLKPDNSPGAFVSQETLKGAGSEAYFGNYLLQVMAGALITVAAPVAIIIIAIGGLLAVVSHGDPGLMGKAKKTVQWAIIGLLVIIFAWVIIRTTIGIVITTNSNQGNTPASQQQGAKTTGGSGTGQAPPK